MVSESEKWEMTKKLMTQRQTLLVALAMRSLLLFVLTVGVLWSDLTTNDVLRIMLWLLAISSVIDAVRFGLLWWGDRGWDKYQ